MSNLKKKLSHIYWIGGSPCSGKTSIARMLTEEQGFRYYKSDDFYDDHLLRSQPALQPKLNKLKGLSWGQYWSDQFCSISVEQQTKDTIDIYEEQFPMMIEDLLSLPSSTPIIVEGAIVLPQRLAPLLEHSNQAIWLLPTSGFQITKYAQRPWVHDVLELTEDPEEAFRNWMQKEIGFARKIEEATRLHDFKFLKVDGNTSLEETFNYVKNHFKLT